MKKPTTDRKKLALTRQTVAALDTRALAEVGGGVISNRTMFCTTVVLGTCLC